MTADYVSGYKEIEHTADISLRVWSKSLQELFILSVEGFNSILGIELLEKDINTTEQFLFTGIDLESCLVALLNECNFRVQQDSVNIQVKEITVNDTDLSGVFLSQKIKGYKKEVKAVTFHKLKIKKLSQGYSVTIVFDV